MTSLQTFLTQTSKSRWGLGFLALGAFGVSLFSLTDDDDKREAHAASPPPAAEQAQSTVVTGTHPVGAFVIITLNPSADVKAVAKTCAKLPKLISQFSTEEPKPFKLPSVMAGVSFSTQRWDEICSLSGIPKPKSGFNHFSTKSGDLGKMPATGGDIFLHVKAETQSLCFEVVKSFVESLPKGSIAKVDDKYSFQFQDGRDLSGFLDGTENPGDEISRREAALLPNGGSYVIHQRWIHNLPKLHALPQEEQEAMVGRTKEDSAEIPREQMRKSAHVFKTRDESFKRIPIVRQSMPFGTLNEHGLLFIAYSDSTAKFDQMLDQMVGKRNGNESDAIMKFSNCIASNYYYCPSLKELSSL